MEVAKVLFPEVKNTNTFIGLVKSEPERFASYGEKAFFVVKMFKFLNFLLSLDSSLLVFYNAKLLEALFIYFTWHS